MASISGIRDGLQTRLATIDGLRVYDTWPNQIHPPAALVKPVEGPERQVIGSTGPYSLRFDVIVVVAAQPGGLERAQDTLDGYLTTTGASSIQAAIEAGRTLGGNAIKTYVLPYTDYGGIEILDVEYLGARIPVEVWAA